MFSTFLILTYCCSLVGSLSIDPVSNEKYTDGTHYTIKSVGSTYTQRVSDHGQCSVELNNESEQSKTITEGEIIKIKNKWFKVEDCRLNRAYRVTCGSRFFYQLRDLACSFVEQQDDTNKMSVRRQTKYELIQLLDKSYYNMCCENACTISEFIQYCPLKNGINMEKK